jgi:large subunit ribosomal protein L18
MSAPSIREARARRKRRIRGRLEGTPQRPRVSVFRSNKAIYAQLVDDATAATLVAARSAEITSSGLKKSEVAKKVGELLAQRAKDKGIERVVFDRSGYLYHGRVKALAEGAREGGLVF